MRRKILNHKRRDLRGAMGVGAITVVSSLVILWVIASLLVHALPHDISDRATAPILP
jgi:hypothetical protein